MFSSNQLTSSQGYLVLPLLLLLGSGSPSARSMADMARRAKRNTALDTMASVSRMDWGGSAGHLFKNDPGAPGSLKTQLCHPRSLAHPLVRGPRARLGLGVISGE